VTLLETTCAPTVALSPAALQHDATVAAVLAVADVVNRLDFLEALATNAASYGYPIALTADDLAAMRCLLNSIGKSLMEE
jgi:hypothetical protein